MFECKVKGQRVLVRPKCYEWIAQQHRAIIHPGYRNGRKEDACSWGIPRVHLPAQAGYFRGTSIDIRERSLYNRKTYTVVLNAIIAR